MDKLCVKIGVIFYTPNLVPGILQRSRKLQMSEKTARKLHLVLGHPTIDRMKKTIMSGLQGQDPQKLKLLMNAITKYTVACETCNKCAKHKPAPKVCLPMATRFDEVLAFDITYWNDPIKNQTHLILHYLLFRSYYL